MYARIAQLVERRAYTSVVEGSSPSARTHLDNLRARFVYVLIYLRGPWFESMRADNKKTRFYPCPSVGVVCFFSGGGISGYRSTS